MYSSSICKDHEIIMFSIVLSHVQRNAVGLWINSFLEISYFKSIYY